MFHSNIICLINLDILCSLFSTFWLSYLRRLSLERDRKEEDLCSCQEQTCCRGFERLRKITEMKSRLLNT